MTSTTHKGSCHCGAVTFEIESDLAPAVHCNCSLCRRKGAFMTPPFAADRLKVLTGQEALSVYQFNTFTAEHYFCRHCGVYTFNRTRKDPAYWRANVGCLENVDPFSLASSVLDGASTSVVINDA